MSGALADVTLLAVALAGEDSFWLCVPRDSKPLTANWKYAYCYWLYPVERDVSAFANISGFTVTDSVFVLNRDYTSKVKRFATLAMDVSAKMVSAEDSPLGNVCYFVPREEINRLDERYKALLQRELTFPPTAGNTSDPASNIQALSEASGPAYSVTTRDPPDISRRDEVNTTTKQPHVVIQNISNRKRAFSNLSVSSHKRKTPVEGTVVYVAPTSRKATGDHSSTEAFLWSEKFIVHRGSVDYLCSKATGNAYGFKLDKVIHDGFPVFLLFPSSVNNSLPVDASANGVPVYQCATLNGAGGDAMVESTVMVLTRPVRERNSSKASSTPQKQRRGRARPSSSSEDGASDSSGEVASDSSSDEYDDVEDVPISRRMASRGRGRASQLSPARQRGRTEEKKPPAQAPHPLQAVGVNLWGDPESALPSVAQLAKQHPFTMDTSTALHTTVFTDGTCVTYTPATAAKVGSDKKMGKPGSDANSGSSMLSSSAPADVDMRGLLEHIQLAKEQVSETA